LIASLGHMWFFMMILVLLEWTVAYWEWYGAVNGLDNFRVHDYPRLERLNALGRFMGDPCFVSLASITDMRDAIDGNTGMLLRRTILFLLVSLITALPTKLILQDTFVDLGYIDPSFAADPNRICGIWNGGSFIFARAAFLPIIVLMSLQKVNCIRGIEWPWACLVFALLVPAALDGLPHATDISDTHSMDFQTFALRKVRFIKELCPYYFVYPMFLAGTRFPGWVVALKGRSWLRAAIVTAIGFVGFIWYWNYLEIPTTNAVDVINERHTQWRGLLKQWHPAQNWDLLNKVGEHFDLCAASEFGLLFVFFCCMMPTTPSILSYFGTQCLACYTTFPLTLIPAGHFVGVMLMNVAEPYRAYMVPIGVLTLLVLLMALTSQPMIPDCVLRWVIGHADMSPFTASTKFRSFCFKFRRYFDPCTEGAEELGLHDPKKVF